MKSAILFFVVLFAVQIMYGQESIPSPRLLDSLVRSNGEVRSARFDAFFVELQNDPTATGYVYIYCGKTCRYGEIEAHFRGIELKIARSKFDRSRITVVHGGYRELNEVELWLHPAGAGAPPARSSVNIKNVAFTKVTKSIIEPYDCCDPLEAQWKAFRPKN